MDNIRIVNDERMELILSGRGSLHNTKERFYVVDFGKKSRIEYVEEEPFGWYTTCFTVNVEFGEDDVLEYRFVFDCRQKKYLSISKELGSGRNPPFEIYAAVDYWNVYYRRNERTQRIYIKHKCLPSTSPRFLLCEMNPRTKSRTLNCDGRKIYFDEEDGTFSVKLIRSKSLRDFSKEAHADSKSRSDFSKGVKESQSETQNISSSTVIKILKSILASIPYICYKYTQYLRIQALLKVEEEMKRTSLFDSNLISIIYSFVKSEIIIMK